MSGHGTAQPSGGGRLAHFVGGPLDGQTRTLDVPSIFRSHGKAVYVRTESVVAGETWYRCLGRDERPPEDLPIREVGE